MSRASRVTVAPSFFIKAVLPFIAPIMLTMILMILVGESWPRNIAPGSGLKFAGLCATVVASACVWHWAVRGVTDLRARKFAAILCAITGLLGWPVWTMGIMPSVNGSILGDERTFAMMLERTETTRQSKSDIVNHWAWLRSDGIDAAVASGRYYIPGSTYADWSRRQPGGVRIRIARGILGAEVVTGFE